MSQHGKVYGISYVESHSLRLVLINATTSFQLIEKHCTKTNDGVHPCTPPESRSPQPLRIRSFDLGSNVLYIIACLLLSTILKNERMACFATNVSTLFLEPVSASIHSTLSKVVRFHLHSVISQTMQMGTYPDYLVMYSCTSVLFHKGRMLRSCILLFAHTQIYRNP